MKNAIFVIQSSLFEGWGTTVEDAKVPDKTIFMSDIPAHRERRNHKCRLFDPHNAVVLAELIAQENEKGYTDDIEAGIADIHRRAKTCSNSF